VLQLPPTPPEEAGVLPVVEQCMGLVLSYDCTPISHDAAQTPVLKHTVALVSYTLQQKACARHQYFNPNEAVMLCLTILLGMCQNFEFHPEVGLFVSHRQHHIHRYN